jgi:hypothetical protein
MRVSASPGVIAGLIDHLKEELKEISGDSSLEINFKPPLEEVPTASVYEIHFNTAHHTGRPYKQGSLGILNFYADQAKKEDKYYQMGEISLTAGPNQTSYLRADGFDCPDYPKHQAVIDSILERLEIDGFIKAGRSRNRTPFRKSGDEKDMGQFNAKMEIKERSSLKQPQHLRVNNFGPIKSADVTFGDLTVFVGPQATGKSILLQLLKLLLDRQYIKNEFRRAGIDWGDQFSSFLGVYFGEGMQSLWDPKKTEIIFNRDLVDLPQLVKSAKAHKGESMFFIPAQRVLAMREGWPQAFTYYDPGVPFAVREFSEELRLMMNQYGSEKAVFPMPRRLKDEFRQMVQQHIFPTFDLKVDTERAQKRLVLSSGDSSLPFMVWSAGQREFVPLLLGLYHLLTPAGAPRRSGVEWAVIEELEMGLHPRAIGVIILMIFDLMVRGYKVCISTHSPQVLDALWALKHLRENGAKPEALLAVFEAPATSPMLDLARQVLRKTSKVYYFDRESGATRDISELDTSSEETGESGWGGLSEFSGRANEAVARAVANADRGGRK